MRRPVLSYANVMSTLAVVLAMSGTAVAATQISGTTIKDRTISHQKLALNTVTGAEVNESTLARVPNADKLDGLDSAAFVKGTNVKVYQGKRTGLPNDTATNAALLSVPGLGQLTVTCGGTGLSWLFTNTTSSVEVGSSLDADALGAPSFFTTTMTPNTIDNIMYQQHADADPDTGFLDDITVQSRATSRAVAHIHLSGATNVGGAGKCDAAAIATVY